MKNMLLLIVMTIMTMLTTLAQINWKKGGNNFTPLGFPPTIGSDFTWNSPIEFITNGAPRMHINEGVGSPCIGCVGIGILAPTQRLSVNAGNINIVQGNRGYMFNDVMTLWRGNTGNINNIFVGAGTGGFNTGTNNTFCGSLVGKITPLVLIIPLTVSVAAEITQVADTIPFPVPVAGSVTLAAY